MKYIIKNQDLHIFQNLFYDTETGNLLSPVETQNYSIIQVADSRYNRGFSIGEHCQLCDLEITFSHINGLVCSADGKDEKVDKHNVYLSFRGETHSLKSRKSAHFQTLAIDFKAGGALLLDAVRKKANEQRMFCTPGLVSCFGEIINEFRLSSAPFFAVNLDALITSALVKLVRAGEKENLDQIISYDETFSQIKHYIDTDFLRIGSLEELSAIFGYTYSYISKGFLKANGTTPKKYLTDRKMEYACTLLGDGVLLEEVAETLGYSSAFNFSRAFKSHFGVTPSLYRNRTKE